MQVWRRSKELALAIYKVTEPMPVSEKYGLVSQLRRAAVSVPTNIAEGSARRNLKEYLQFLFIAKGSLSEIDTLLELSADLTYISAESFDELNLRVSDVSGLLNGLINSLKVRVER